MEQTTATLTELSEYGSFTRYTHAQMRPRAETRGRGNYTRGSFVPRPCPIQVYEQSNCKMLISNSAAGLPWFKHFRKSVLSIHTCR